MDIAVIPGDGWYAKFVDAKRNPAEWDLKVVCWTLDDLGAPVAWVPWGSVGAARIDALGVSPHFTGYYHAES